MEDNSGMIQTWSELLSSDVYLDFSVSGDCEFLADFSSGRLGDVEHLNH